MKIIGLTGGSGAGKSVVAAELKKLGAGIVDADAIYRKLCDENLDMLLDLQKAFGDILTIDKKLDRAKLAGIVFSDSNKLKKLNEITIFYIKKASDEKFKALKDKGIKIAIYDAPTLFQTGTDSICDGVIGIIADRNIRIERIIKRDNISEKAAIARIDAQPDDKFYYDRCQYIIKNNVSHETLKNQVKQLWQRLVK
ncbi:MAG TPA: dephospho-CoA kinase [Candidatus Butyricicoccus avistercoris]|uniref:Dephospho-CoA kinase n=1 Tax=Candidatus Butyricicoccus avistercoris TaxID=2838518 RepID=A0A9D1PIN6_9FIRM|nr:dephospho-CoA kinase [Candidatus Butyricicoccus avistercoris]